MQREWQSRMFMDGWAGLHWPREFGGKGATYAEVAIFLEECARAQAPEPINMVGLSMVGPTLISHGTSRQKSRYLEKILSGEEIWCQGFSEPDSGSDLASLRTTAIRQGNSWSLTGQKVWTSKAQVASFCMLLARTSPRAVGHNGITCFVVDMHAPGVNVRPLRDITGGYTFAEIFLDSVEIDNSQVLGEVDNGWQVAMTTLLYERGTQGLVHHARARVLFAAVVDLAGRVYWAGRPAIEVAQVRRRLAELSIEVEAMSASAYRLASELIQSNEPAPGHAILKLQWGELSQQLVDFALELQGESAAIDDGRWQHEILRARANTVAGGTSEIIRNLIAERVLGLPRSR
jgi:alkylation response protein AidB-like acyl-CoA dehydrogenase